MVQDCQCPKCQAERSKRSRLVMRAFIILIALAALLYAAYCKP